MSAHTGSLPQLKFPAWVPVALMPTSSGLREAESKSRTCLPSSAHFPAYSRAVPRKSSDKVFASTLYLIAIARGKS